MEIEMMHANAAAAVQVFDEWAATQAAIQLRPYQEQALQAIRDAERGGVRRPLVQMATGLGKTVVFGKLIADLTKTDGARALVLAHRDELIEQAADKIGMMAPADLVGIAKAERDEADKPIVVASVQTLQSAARRQRVQRGGAFRLVVVDEAHHAVAPSYRMILSDLGAFSSGGPTTLGVTATPQRGDRIGLDAVFERLVFEMGILDGIRQEYLADLRGLQIKLALDLDRVSYRAGDFADGDLSDAMARANAPAHVVQAVKTHAANRKTLVFTPTVALAGAMADTFTRAGFQAGTVHGAMGIEERRGLVRDFREGKIQVLTNCAVLTEGFDEPSVDCIVVARPTASSALYTQMIGRGTRKFPGKSDCLVIDCVGASSRHALVSSASLLGLPVSTMRDKGARTAIVEVDEEQARRAAAGWEEVKAPAKGASTGTITAAPVRLFGDDLRWLKFEGGFILALGDEGTVALRPSGDHWGAIRYPRDFSRSVEPLVTGVTLAFAQGRAEDFVRQRATWVAKPGKWRDAPASDSQRGLLTKFRIPHHAGLTKGQAADALALHFHSIDRRRKAA